MPSQRKHASQFTRDALFKELGNSLRLKTTEEASPDGTSALDALQTAWQRLAPAMPAGEWSPEKYEQMKRIVSAAVSYQVRNAYRRNFRRGRILSKYPHDGPKPEQGPDPLQQLAARQIFERIFLELADDAPALRLLAATLPRQNSAQPQIDYKDTEALAAHLECSIAEVTNIKKRLVRAARRVLAELNGSKG